jgi:hypothetical protein
MIDKTLFVVCIFLVFGLSSCASVTEHFDGYYEHNIYQVSMEPYLIPRQHFYHYEYNIGQGHILKSFLKSSLKKLIKYPDVRKAFADGSLPIPGDTLKDYAVEPFIPNSEDVNPQIQVKYHRQSRWLVFMNRSKRLILEPPKGGLCA